MASPHWSLQDAKNSFSALVAAAQKGVPQTVTKRGKPADALFLSAITIGEVELGVAPPRQ